MKYIAYCRVSTAEQGRSGLGLQAQKSLIEQAVGTDNVIAYYTDIQSGKVKERANLELALQKCAELRCGFIVAKIDRLGRDVSHLFTLKEFLEKEKIEFKVADMPQMNTLTFGIYAVIAQHEREIISKRTKDALQEKKKQGFKLGRPATGRKDSYYTPVTSPTLPQEKGRLGGEAYIKKIHDSYIQKIAPILNLIKLFYTSNPSATDAQLVRYLNQINYPTLSGKGKWHQSTIVRLKKYFTK